MTEAQVGLELLTSLGERASRVSVVGDVILDGWWTGRAERMSREAPAPVVEIETRVYAPGGAANTAVNLAALGARVRLVGLVGDDEAGHQLRDMLLDRGVDVELLRAAPGMITVTKNRVVCADQILLRLDETHRPLAPPDCTELTSAVAAALVDAAALVVCDYGSELWPDAVRAALATGPRPPLVVVDAHDPARWAGVCPDLVTPNAAEAFRLLRRPEPVTERAEAIARGAAELVRRTSAAAVIVTLDRDGTLLVEPTSADSADVTHRTRATAVQDQQAAGAGDTFVAAVTLARAAGLPLPVAAEVGQLAANVVVHRPGTAVCSAQDLLEHLALDADRVVDHDTLAARVAEARTSGRRVVVTNGCFDMLHPGHTSYLRQAARLGDLLVVAVNSDDSVRRLKGPGRPVNTDVDRAGLLAALGCVTYVTIFDTDTPIPLLERLQPDVYAKGGDYTPEMLAETAVVEAYGGQVRIVDYVPAKSTTAMVERIRASSP